MKISMYATKEEVRCFAMENGYLPNDGVMAQIYALYEIAKWKRAEIANHLDYAVSTVSTKRSKMWEYTELAEVLFSEVGEIEEVAEILDEVIAIEEEKQEEEKRVLMRRFRDNRPDVPMEFMSGCGENLKNVNAVYFFKFYDSNSLLFNKIGTSARDVVGRLRDEIGEYTKKFDIRRVEIHRIRSCGEMPPEGAESMLRAEIMKRYPNTFRKNDRFFGVDVPTELFDEIVSNYLG